MQAIQNQSTRQFINTIAQGDCIDIMQQMPANSVDFILTDPPYLVNYRDRDGRTIRNDANADWLKPAMAEAYRVLKQNRVAVMFYGWSKVDAFFAAWKDAGFQPVGHLVFQKSYASKSRFLRYAHEQAFLLVKGRPPLPKQPLMDVMEMPYSGNKLHATLQRDFSQSLDFFSNQLQSATLQRVNQQKTLQTFVLDPGAPDVDIEIDAVNLIDLRQPPYSAQIQFEKVFRSPDDGTEQRRERWTVNVIYGFRDEVPNDMLLTNPLGLVISYVHADQAFGS